MNVSWLTIRDLEYLVAVAKTLHFGKAASVCRVSQPALSTQIKKVESLFGVQIFERTNRRVSLTEAGSEVVRRAKDLLEKAGELASLHQTSLSPLEGAFHLGAIASLGPYIIPHFLPALRKAYPKLKLFLREGLTDDLLKQLEEGKLDAVLLAKTFNEDRFQVTSLFHERFVLAVPNGHPLALKKELSPKDLEPSDMVLLEEGHCLKDQTLELCARGKRKETPSFQATSLETLRHLVGAGVGYTLFPELAMRQERGMDKVITFRKFKDDIGREIVLASRKTSPRHKDIALLARFLIHHVPL